jgi:hypothetical protein
MKKKKASMGKRASLIAAGRFLHLAHLKFGLSVTPVRKKTQNQKLSNIVDAFKRLKRPSHLETIESLNSAKKKTFVRFFVCRIALCCDSA